MKKYHIMSNGGVDLCTAKKRCRLGGKSGIENHFTNKEDAQKASEEKLAAQFGNTKSVSRSVNAARNDTNVVLKELAKDVKVTRVKSVGSYDPASDTGSKEESSVAVLSGGSEKALLEKIKAGNMKFSF